MVRTNKRDPRAERTLRRVSYTREVKQTFLIICEGMNTEPDYFNAFRLTSANIKAVGQGINTVGLVQKAIRIREEERKKGRKSSAGWCSTRMTFRTMTSTGQLLWLKRTRCRWRTATKRSNIGFSCIITCYKDRCTGTSMRQDFPHRWDLHTARRPVSQGRSSACWPIGRNKPYGMPRRSCSRWWTSRLRKPNPRRQCICWSRN